VFGVCFDDCTIIARRVVVTCVRLYSSRNTGGTIADGAVSILVSTNFVIANTAVLFVEGTVDPAAACSDDSSDISCSGYTTKFRTAVV
jgi:hypothetical protein